MLIESLEAMPEDKVRITISPRPVETHLTIVGDWFAAESLTPRPGRGDRQTTFTWHGPTALRYARAFDQAFARVCCEAGMSPEGSRDIRGSAKRGAGLACRETPKWPAIAS